ncbi:hypothetical protein ACDF64_13545 [Agromyces sp. MMS24-JH15]|uniref:hypothetical protein n=1 Tax=Agromyces sp. MMS24-JH15 TaxID=3243765 RepID=UPI003749D627
MAREEAGRPSDGNAYTRFFDRIDQALEPIFGAPPTVHDTEVIDPEAQRARPCPVCGHPISEHYIDESTSNVLLECPTDERLPEREVRGPYNELGMPATGRRLERYEQGRAAAD